MFVDIFDDDSGVVWVAVVVAVLFVVGGSRLWFWFDFCFVFLFGFVVMDLVEVAIDGGGGGGGVRFQVVVVG